jgi:hypothetical protein
MPAQPQMIRYHTVFDVVMAPDKVEGFKKIMEAPCTSEKYANTTENFTMVEKNPGEFHVECDMILASGMKTSIEKAFKAAIPNISAFRMREVNNAKKEV